MTDIDSEEWRLRERASLFDLCRQMLLFRLSLCLMMLATRATSHLLGDTCTIAGNGATGYADGAAGAASFSGPSGISTWANGRGEAEAPRLREQQGTPSLWSTLETTWSGCSPAHRSRRSPGTGGRASQTVRRHRLSSTLPATWPPRLISTRAW